MRAGVYIRVSTDEQAQHGYSLAEQKESCSLRAKELGATKIIEYADEGLSGASLDRPGLESLRQDISNGLIDVFITRDPDRLSRKLAHQLLLTEEFEKAGIRLEFLDFEWRDTAEGRLFYSLKGAVAEYEREKIRERMVRGKHQKAKQGGIPGNFNVYGYNYNPEAGVVSLHPEEAEIVKKIFDWFVTEDISIIALTERLNSMLIPTKKRVGFWHRQVVRQILVNSVYVGQWQYGNSIIPVPGIVDMEVYVAAQDKLKEARRLWAGKSKHEYLLSGIITCSDCGNPMTGVYTKWWNKGYRRYSCFRRPGNSRNTGCNPAKFIMAESIEELVWEEIKTLLTDSDTIAEEAIKNNSTDHIEKELSSIQKHLADTEKGRETILETLSLGLVELDDKIKNKLKNLRRRQEQLKSRQSELKATLLRVKSIHSSLNEYRLKALEILNGIDSLESKEKKALIRLLVSQVIVSGRPVRTAYGKGLDGLSVSVIMKTDALQNSLKNPPL